MPGSPGNQRRVGKLEEAGGGVAAGTERTQTLVLTLTPGLYDAQGNLKPLDVAGQQPQPGG
jgi:hypothetical protein